MRCRAISEPMGWIFQLGDGAELEPFSDTTAFSDRFCEQAVIDLTAAGSGGRQRGKFMRSSKRRPGSSEHAEGQVVEVVTEGVVLGFW